MDRARRQRYLKQIGIDHWQPRDAVAEVAAVPRSAVPAVAAPVVEPARAAAPVSNPRPLPAAPAPRPRSPGRPPINTAVPVPHVAEPAPPPRVQIELPHDWAGLRARVKDCTGCKLCQTRTNTVFGVGDEQAPLMIVGEGPGADEDARGEPFVGRAGQLLDEMLKAIGRSRQQADAGKAVFIANVVKCRPPGNRDPEADEVEACRPYLDRQIELLKPKLIVALGRVAAQRLLDTDAPLSRLRGPLYQYGAERTPVLVTYHPAYLLRSPREKAKSWEDLKRIHRFLLAPP